MGQNLDLEQLTEDATFDLTKLNKGRFTVPSNIREVLGVNGSENVQLFVWVEDAENGIIGGKLIEQNDLLNLINGD